MRTTPETDPRPGGPRDRGFTLVEILIAIVLVGILSAVVVVGVSNLTSKGSASACKASLDASKAGAVVYFANTGGYPADFGSMVSVDPPALTLPTDVTMPTPLSLQGSGWTLTMTAVTGKPPTFVCS